MQPAVTQSHSSSQQVKKKAKTSGCRQVHPEKTRQAPAAQKKATAEAAFIIANNRLGEPAKKSQ